MSTDAQRREAATRTILIIDDEAAVRNVTRTLLERAGFRVLTAAGGAEGIALFTAEPAGIDLVLLDLTMPQMNGNEVLAELARMRPTSACCCRAATARPWRPHEEQRGRVPSQAVPVRGAAADDREALG